MTITGLWGHEYSEKQFDFYKTGSKMLAKCGATAGSLVLTVCGVTNYLHSQNWDYHDPVAFLGKLGLAATLVTPLAPGLTRFLTGLTWEDEDERIVKKTILDHL